MIKIAQALLILGEEDDMAGLTVGDPTAGAKLRHDGIDRLERMDVVLLIQLAHEPVHDEAADHGVVSRTVMIEIR